MALGLKYKNEESILEEAGTVTPFLEFPLFKNTPRVRAAYLPLKRLERLHPCL